MRFPESELAHELCDDLPDGIEIGGSAHNPFGLRTRNVDITDSTDTVFKRSELELCGETLPVDIVAPGDKLPLRAGSVGFVVSSHVLEHIVDPLDALLEWDRVCKVGGVIFAIIPHKERTFDKDRERTTLAHIIEDYEDSAPESNAVNGHEHVWITQDVVDIIDYAIDALGVQWEWLACEDTDDKAGNGFTVAVRKTGRRKR